MMIDTLYLKPGPHRDKWLLVQPDRMGLCASKGATGVDLGSLEWFFYGDPTEIFWALGLIRITRPEARKIAAYLKRVGDLCIEPVPVLRQSGTLSLPRLNIFASAVKPKPERNPLHAKEWRFLDGMLDACIDAAILDAAFPIPLYVPESEPAPSPMGEFHHYDLAWQDIEEALGGLEPYERRAQMSNLAAAIY